MDRARCLSSRPRKTLAAAGDCRPKRGPGRPPRCRPRGRRSGGRNEPPCRQKRSRRDSCGNFTAMILTSVDSVGAVVAPSGQPPRRGDAEASTPRNARMAPNSLPVALQLQDGQPGASRDYHGWPRSGSVATAAVIRSAFVECADQEPRRSPVLTPAVYIRARRRLITYRVSNLRFIQPRSLAIQVPGFDRNFVAAGIGRRAEEFDVGRAHREADFVASGARERAGVPEAQGDLGPDTRLRDRATVVLRKVY